MSSFVIDISVHDPRWQHVPDMQSIADTAVMAAITHIETKPFEELSIALQNDAGVQELNKAYRAQDKPTNVLSFPAGGAFTPVLGDIVLAYETIAREADDKHVSFEHHLTHLIVHGFLHLNGYDHEIDVEATQMEALETQILQGLGIADPYDKDNLL